MGFKPAPTVYKGVSMKYQNKVALVTGASRGLGKAIALALAAEGAEVIVHYRRQGQDAEDLVKQITTQGGRAWAVAADLCYVDQVQKMWDQIVERYSKLDMLVFNAASTAFKPLLELSEKHIQLTFDLVVKNFLLAVQRAVPLMQSGGSIVTISGMDTIQVCPGHGLLGAAKASLEMLTRYLAVELSSKSIFTYCLNPGFLETDSTRFYLQDKFIEIVQGVQQQSAFAGATRVEEMAKIVLFLGSPEARSLTGQMITADGLANRILHL